MPHPLFVAHCAKADHVFSQPQKRHSWDVYPGMEQEYFTPRQVARLLRVDYTTVIRWIKTGLLDVETIQEGRRNRHRIKQSVIEAIERRDPKHQRVLV